MLPITLTYVVVIATAVWGLERLGIPFGTGYGLVLFAINLALAVGLLWGVDRGRLIEGTREFQAHRRMVA